MLMHFNKLIIVRCYEEEGDQDVDNVKGKKYSRAAGYILNNYLWFI